MLPSSLRRLILVLSVGLAAAAIWIAPAAGSGLQESRRTLQEIQQRIARTRQSLAQKKQSEKSLQAGLALVERDLAQIRRQIKGLNGRLTDLDRDLARKNAQIQHSRRRMATLEQRVRQRLVAMYEGGDLGLLRVLFATHSPSRTAEEYDYFSHIVRRDRELLADYHRNLIRLRQSLAQLEDLRAEQRKTLAQRRRNRSTIAQALRLKKDLLAQVHRQRKTISTHLTELKRRARRLKALIKKLERNKSPEYTQASGIFADQKGRLPWPASGALKVGFGTWRHPGLGTLYDSQGIEIAAGTEAPIKAVWPGRVVFANWFKGYGELLIIDHGGGYYTLYAKASRLTKKVGAKVAAGDVIGYAGKERGRVYFEIRQGSTPLNPIAWLAPR